MRPRLLAACLGVAAAVCFLVAYLNRNPDLDGTHVEGAYFDASPGKGWTGYAPLDDYSTFDPFDPWNGYLWLGAGIALVLVAVAVLVLGRFASRFARPS
jgi:hypothetical protein